ncbi:MAG: AbrB/MazE/SpoVT family DNA-binding domain-containing protein [Verrucomicrobia bacterium]|nr:MAG: AbrB/MazE/SpoVT family DNA-binding domain-containing protein [Verrucomicrobiota bacterium]
MRGDWWHPSAMSITITVGKAGRLVVPKAIRDNLGLREGSRLRLEVLGGKFEAVPETDGVRIVMKNGFPVIRGGPPLREGDITKSIKEDREARAESLVRKSK